MRRLAGHLKICSASVFFVPRDVAEPIFRVPYAETMSIDRRGPDAGLTETARAVTLTADCEGTAGGALPRHTVWMWTHVHWTSHSRCCGWPPG